MADRRERFDAIVVGGGHNGLTCAAYLARARTDGAAGPAAAVPRPAQEQTTWVVVCHSV